MKKGRHSRGFGRFVGHIERPSTNNGVAGCVKCPSAKKCQHREANDCIDKHLNTSKAADQCGPRQKCFRVPNESLNVTLRTGGDQSNSRRWNQDSYRKLPH